MNTQQHLISDSISGREALQSLNELSVTLTLFVLDEDKKLVGTLTDGDIRRGLLNGVDLDGPVSNFVHTKFRALRQGAYSATDVQEIREKGIKLIPVLDEEGRILRMFDLSEIRSILPLDAVIMAGGRGSRLRPLTDTVPKPLLKIGGTPIIEQNVIRLKKFGVRNLTISVRYLGEQLEAYFGDGADRDMNIGYVWETEPLGTAGAVRLVENLEHDTLLIMNSDLLTDINFEEMMIDFEQSKADMMVACIPYEVDIPYAIMETEGDRVTGFKEKPTYTYYANAGIYMIKRKHLSLIPGEGPFDATDLMNAIIDAGLKLSSFPIYGYWLDIGKPQDYEKAQRDIDHLQL